MKSGGRPASSRGVGHRQRARAIADVAIELLPQPHQQVAQLVDLRARGRVLVDALAAVVVQFQLEVARQVGGRAGGANAGQRGVGGRVQRQLGFEAIGRLRQRLGRRAHGGIGMELADDRRQVPGRLEVHEDVVVGPQRLFGGARAAGRRQLAEQLRARPRGGRSPVA